MSATPPSAASGRQPAVRPQPSGVGAATGVGGAAVLVGTRMALWLGVQLGLAGLLLVTGRAATGGEALNDAAGWWMVYAALVDLSTLAVIRWLLRRAGRSYRSLLGPPTAVWQIALWALAVLAASVPAVVFSGELTSAVYGQATAPMFAVVDVAPVAGVLSVLVAPLLAELAEPVAYLGVVLPRLEERLGRSWLAAVIVVAVWAGEHALYPLLASGGGLDLGFAAYRVASVLPYLATWTALYYALGRRLLPIMAARWVFNGGTALALALGLVE
jgi:Type II CAAX prenyl endopeptidase Rce1-like